MSNLLESSQNTATEAPSYYNNYMSNLATKGQEAGAGAQYIGATDLQNKAFSGVEGAATAYQPTLNAAGNTLNAATDVTSPLAAANPYLAQATSDPSKAAAQYMTPYMRSVIDAVGDAGQRNIQQNLSPLATAGAVGAGQFGSKRGAEALGQTLANYGQQTTGQQLGALQKGYSDAMAQAQAQAQLQGQLGQIAGGFAQNQAANQLQAGSTLGQLTNTMQSNQAQIGNIQGNMAAQEQQNLINAAIAGGNLASQTQQLGMNDVNALATLGAQQQQIQQNAQLFPLQTAAAQANIMRGFTIPTSVSNTYTGPIPGAYQSAPLSQIAGIGSLLGSTQGQNLINGIGSLFGTGLGNTGAMTNGIYNNSYAVPGDTSNPANAWNLNNMGIDFSKP